MITSRHGDVIDTDVRLPRTPQGQSVAVEYRRVVRPGTRVE
jgi:hypothetical protein